MCIQWETKIWPQTRRQAGTCQQPQQRRGFLQGRFHGELVSPLEDWPGRGNSHADESFTRFSQSVWLLEISRLTRVVILVQQDGSYSVCTTARLIEEQNAT